MAMRHTLLSFSLCLLVLVSFGTYVHSRTSPDEDAEMMKMYEKWMVKHKRVHNSVVEKDRRFQIFKDNVKLVNDHNKVEGRMYDLAVNKFADLTNEEFKAIYAGFRGWKGAQARSAVSNRGMDVLDDVPDSIDWREKGAVGSVKDQGMCGSCWAFATVAAMEGITQIKTGKLWDLSERELVDCDTYDYGCGGGLLVTAFNWTMQNKGLNSEEAYPYKAEQGTCQKEKCDVSVASITGFDSVPENDEKALQVAVSKQPVAVGIEASYKFQLYGKGIFVGEDCSNALDHAVTVVGYGSLANGTEYWIVKNSWNSDWGEDGYVRMLRNVEAKEGVCGLAMMAAYPL